MQLSLDAAQIAEDDPLQTVELAYDFAEVQRHQLDEHTWVEIVPGFLSPERLFAQLLRDLEWSQRRRWVYNRKVDEPRLTADYPNIDAVPSPALLVLAQRLSACYGVRYDGLWVNLYRDERDSTGWHRDRITCKRDLCTVPVLTLGHHRRFLVKPRAGGDGTRFTPAAAICP
jgi:alkylated DNA repair dioxygenase AlkB